jgi:hypothetical protein
VLRRYAAHPNRVFEFSRTVPYFALGARVAVMRAGLAVLGAVAMLSACGSVEGPLLYGRESDGGVIDAGTPAASAIAQNMRWQYQLTGEPDFDSDIDLFVVDLFQTDAAELAALRAQGKVSVAYLSAGTVESFRSDADDFPESAIGHTLIRYPDEAWLDIRDPGVRAVMAERLEIARSKGFDGVLPTNLSGYSTDTGFDLTAADQLAYSEWLATQAHARGLSIGMAGDFEQAPALIDRFDWAVHYGCIERGDCADLDVFADQGKPVLDVETDGDPAAVCAAAEQLGINVLLKRPDFGAYRVSCL